MNLLTTTLLLTAFAQLPAEQLQRYREIHNMERERPVPLDGQEDTSLPPAPFDPWRVEGLCYTFANGVTCGIQDDEKWHVHDGISNPLVTNTAVLKTLGGHPRYSDHWRSKRHDAAFLDGVRYERFDGVWKWQSLELVNPDTRSGIGIFVERWHVADDQATLKKLEAK